MSEAIGARKVNVGITIDGVAVAGAISVEIFQSGAYCADRFVVLMAFSDATGGAYYAQLSAPLMSISLNLGTNITKFETPFILGYIDNINLDFNAHVVTLSGRDLSSRLIDSEVNQSFANQTASDIAISFCLAAGLTPNVVPTYTAVGQYYELSHTRTALGLHTKNLTQWDLLAALAEVEVYTLSVTGSTLNFVPYSNFTAPATVVDCHDLTDLTVDRSIPLVNTMVTVKSWNTRLKAAHQGVQGSGMSMTLIKPNLMPDQVINIAANKQAQLIAQTRFLHASMPGETNLVPLTMINLQGTNTALDGLYVIQAVDRYINSKHGFSQVIEAYAKE